MDRNSLESLLAREVDIVDSALVEFGTTACVRSVQVAGQAYISYELRLGRQQRLGGVEAVLDDIAARVAQHRRSPVKLRLRHQPSPAIEAPHPQPQALSWKGIAMGGPPSTAAVGISYSSGRPTPVQVSFDDTPHVLVAGTTGSGKSTLLRSLLCTMAWRTPPDLLALRLVDLKNEALVPFGGLPQAIGTGFCDRSAAQQVVLVEAELDRRIAHGGASTAQRIVLVVDELAQLDDASKTRLGRILALGRSRRVHVVAATQHPTKQTVGEKANFPLRLVGRVGDASASALCCGRPGAGAEQLPGKGAFVLVDGDVTRFQAADFTDAVAAGIVALLAQRWPRTGAEPVQETSFSAETAVLGAKTGAEPVDGTAMFPLPKRPPTTTEAAAIRKAAGEGLSLNRLVALAYGTKNGTTFSWVKGALSDHA